MFLFTIGTGSGGGQDGETKGGDDLLDVTIYSKPNKDEEKPLPPEEGIAIQTFKTHLNSTGTCDQFYGGIGITYEYFTNKVLNVYKGYPAELNGIKIGDIVQSERGEPGSLVRVVIIRDGKTIVKDITRDKICYEEQK